MHFRVIDAQYSKLIIISLFFIHLSTISSSDFLYLRYYGLLPKWQRTCETSSSFITDSSSGIASRPAKIQAMKVWPVLKSAHFILFRVGQSTKILTDNYMRDSSATRCSSYYCARQIHGIQIAILLKSSEKFRDSAYIQLILSLSERSGSPIRPFRILIIFF